MAERARRQSSKVLRSATLFVLAIIADAGMGRVGRWLTNLAEAARWAKDASFFYAESADRLFHQVHGAYATVLYLALTATLVAAFGRPLLQRRRLRRKGPGRLAELAREHPVLADRVVPLGAGVGWLGLQTGMPLLFEFIARFIPSWGGMPLGKNLHYLAQDLAYQLSRANNLGYVFGSVLAVTGIAAATRFAIRRLTRDPEARPPAPGAVEDQGSFAAVAVTASTQGAVLGLAVLSVVVATLAVRARSNAEVAPLVFSYVLVALGAATLFRRMSRIAVGIDGVLVLGADRTRFFSYAGLDGVKASGSDILLQHRGKTALRLQLHDDDVTRAPALADRIRAAMDHAVRMRGEGADRLMQTLEGRADPAPRRGQPAILGASASERLASSSRGGLDYRQPAIAREQLWQLVEGPISDAAARRVAAEAIAPDMTREEKARLRVVASKCAEPRARVALERLLEDDDTGDEAPAVLPRRRFT